MAVLHDFLCFWLLIIPKSHQFIMIMLPCALTQEFVKRKTSISQHLLESDYTGFRLGNQRQV